MIAEALLEKEVLSSDEINQIIDGKAKAETKKSESAQEPPVGPPPAEGGEPDDPPKETA